MKTAIMTWFQYYNYGTALQVTALSNILKELGHEPYVINYKTSGQTTVIPNNSIKNYTQKLYKRIKNLFIKSYASTYRTQKFEDFFKHNLNFTDYCKTQSDLEKLSSDFDSFICGSDQIWAPNCFDPHYFLDFIYDENIKIAYAPSVGLPSIDDRYIRDNIKKLTSKIKYISTREQSGSELISKLINKQVRTVLDPTLLLNSDYWQRIANNDNTKISESKPYILVYMLGNNNKHWKQIKSISQTLQMELKIIPVFEHDTKRKGCIQEPIGPSEFIQLINNCSYICTDSFHGLAFAINFNKNFCIFERFKNTDTINQNSRIYNLLNLLGLNSRIFKSTSNNNVYSNIDYKIVDQKLDILRQDSISFLKDSLVSVEEYLNVNKKKNKDLFETHSLCCGCGACSIICPTKAITINRNDDGFWNAELNKELCVSCGKCNEVCPLLNRKYNKSIDESMVYSYKDSSKEVLLKSSSGGIAHRLAENGIQKNYSILGCKFDPEKHNAYHVLVRPDNREQITNFAGSKYMQSCFHIALKELKDSSDNAVVFGTPCQIAGARNLLKDKGNLIFVDLICHGIPTYNLYKKYLEYLNNYKNFDTKGYLNTIFRYKPKGWREIYIYNDNKGKYICYDQNTDLYFISFEECGCYSKSCYECPWRDESAADIRIGDYWHKKFSKNQTGVSMVMTFTPNGESFFKEIANKKLGYITKESYNDYYQCQQTKNMPRPVFWEEYIKDLTSEKDFYNIFNTYAKPFAIKRRMNKIINIIRSFIKK